MPGSGKDVIGIYAGGLRSYARGGRIAAGGGLFAGGPFAAGLIAAGLFASGLNAAPHYEHTTILEPLLCDVDHPGGLRCATGATKPTLYSELENNKSTNRPGLGFNLG